MKDIKVKWTGIHPNLCRGRWEISIDGQMIIGGKVDTEGVLYGPMGTEGNYYTWHFGEDWSEEWDRYIDGLAKEHWWQAEQGKALMSLLGANGFVLTNDELDELYDQINEQDFRGNSCGGCI